MKSLWNKSGKLMQWLLLWNNTLYKKQSVRVYICMYFSNILKRVAVPPENHLALSSES